MAEMTDNKYLRKVPSVSLEAPLAVSGVVIRSVLAESECLVRSGETVIRKCLLHAEEMQGCDSGMHSSAQLELKLLTVTDAKKLLVK